jgi:hypothetical protein
MGEKLREGKRASRIKGGDINKQQQNQKETNQLI